MDTTTEKTEHAERLANLIEEHLKNKGFDCTYKVETDNKSDILLIKPQNVSDLKTIKEKLGTLGITAYIAENDELKARLAGINGDLNLDRISERIKKDVNGPDPDPETNLKTVAGFIAEWLKKVRKKVYGPVVENGTIKLTNKDEARDAVDWLITNKKMELAAMGLSLMCQSYAICLVKAQMVNKPLVGEPKTREPEAKVVVKEKGGPEISQIQTKAMADLKLCVPEMRRVGIGIKSGVVPKNSLENLSAYYYMKEKNDSDRLTEILDQAEIAHTFIKNNPCTIKIGCEFLEKLYEKLKSLPAVERTKKGKKEKKPRVKKSDKKEVEKITPVVSPQVAPQATLPSNSSPTLDDLIDSLGEEAVLAKVIDRIVEKKVAARVNEELEKKVEERVVEIKKNLMECLK